VHIAPLTALKAKALGAAGEAWLASLPELVCAFTEEWGVEIGQPFSDGSCSYVARATMADGRPVVLKLAMPDGLEGQGSWARELRAIEFGQGRGYVELIARDVERRAMLLERLGRQLIDTDLTIEAQLDTIARTLAPAWRRDPSSWPWCTGAEQASGLASGVRTDWERCHRPCPEAVIKQAERFALARRDAYEPSTAVVIHGDAHSWNVLESDDGSFKVIDPDAMLSHPAHDLAIPIRHWNDELLEEDDPARVVRQWCARVADATGAPADDIWEWAFVERVSTGLFVMRLGGPDGGNYLAIAERLIDG